MVIGVLLGIAKVAITVAQVVVAVCTAVEAVARLQNFLRPGESSADLGGRFCEADEKGIKRQDFDTYQEYLEAVRALKIDKKDLERFDEKKRRLRFLEEYSRYLQETRQDGSPLKFLLEEGEIMERDPEAALLHDNPNWLRVYMDVFEKAGIDLTKVSEYLEGKLSLEEARMVDQAVHDAERRLSPEKSDDQIRDFIDAVKGKRRS